jgi:restriction system protein
MSNNDIFRLERQFYERFEVYKKVEGDGIPLEGLAWRELEKLVAELLSHENYEVSLGKGSKDEGVDVIAVRKIENIGFFKAIWQVKHSQKGRKVGIEVIRQLADTRNELKASKGIIVTNSFLTREALSRINRDKFTLGKIDRDDLVRWIEKSQPKYKSFLGMLLN